MAHLRIFLNIFALMIGTWAAVYAWQVRRSYAYAFLSPLAGYLVCLNLIIFNDLVDWYLMTNLYSTPGSFESSLYAIIAFPVGFSLFVLYSYFQLRTASDLRGKSQDKPLRIGCVTLLLGGLPLILFSTMRPETLLARGIHWGITGAIYAVLVLRMAVLLMLFRDGHRSREAIFRLMAMMFAVFYLLGFVYPVLFRFGAILPDAHVLLTAVLHLLFAVFPFLWFRWGFLPYHRSRVSEEQTKGCLDRTWERYGISRREREIAELVLQGLRNREIERKLIISPHTVKNHIYRLYKKVGVTNRAQFVRLLMERGEKGY